MQDGSDDAHAQPDVDTQYSAMLTDALHVLESDVRKHVDPRPLKKLCDVLDDIIETRVLPPVDMVAQCRGALWRALALCAPEQIAMVYFGATQTAERICVGELCALAALRLALQLPDGTPTADATHLWPEGGVDVAPGVAVRTYRVSQFVAALQVLRDAMTRCCYSDGLVAYCEELERRAAMLLFFTWSADVCDCETLRERAGPEHYVASIALLQLIWCSFAGINRRLLQAGGMLPVHVVDAIDDEERAALTALHSWFLDRARTMISDESSVMLRRAYPQTQLRPGDAELVRLTRRGIMPDASGVLQCASEPGRMAAVMAEAEVPLPLALMRDLPRLTPGDAEPLQLGLCMFELLDVLTRECGAAAFGLAFAIDEGMVHTDPDSVRHNAVDRPIMAQVFNHWQVLYNNKMFMFNSFLRSLYAWLATMRALAAQRRAAGVKNIDLIEMVVQNGSGTTAYDQLFRLVWPDAADARNDDGNDVVEFLM